MSNNAYLIACDERSPSPTLTLKPRQYEIIAEGVWRVPPLWVSLFRDSDLIRWTWSDGEGCEFSLDSPVLSRRRVAARIREAKEALTRLKVIDHTCLCDMLDALRAHIDELKTRRRYLVCEWQEVAGLDASRHARDMEWLLRFFAKAPVRSVDRRFESLCGVKLSKRFQNPMTTSSSDYSDASWRILDALLGDSPSNEASWLPRRAKKETYSNIALAMHHNDLAAVERMLAAGAEVPPGIVQNAAGGQDPELLRLLLEYGGDPSETHHRHGAPLVRAFNSYSEKSVKEAKIRLLLEHDADPNVTGGRPETILCCCYRHGMKFASAIVAKSKKTVVRRFLQFADSDGGRSYELDNGITWRARFLKVARNRLEQ